MNGYFLSRFAIDELRESLIRYGICSNGAMKGPTTCNKDTPIPGNTKLLEKDELLCERNENIAQVEYSLVGVISLTQARS